jgi:hypothetical protein
MSSRSNEGLGLTVLGSIILRELIRRIQSGFAAGCRKQGHFEVLMKEQIASDEVYRAILRAAASKTNSE